MKALIVDDEPLARRELARLLAAFPAVRVIGEAANIDEAQVRIEELGPDVVFLHGTSGHFEAFSRNVVPHVEAGFRVDAIDMLGHGYTGKPDYAWALRAAGG